MIKSIQKFFASPWRAPKIPERTEIGLDEFFRVDPSKKPKVAPGVQKPGYQLPDNSDYKKWCEWRISETNKSHSKFIKNEKSDQSNVSNVISFNSAIGLRDFTDSPIRNKSVSGT